MGIFGENGGLLSMVLSMGLLAGVFYFLLIRPEKKRKKELSDLRDNLKVGDQITTIGGITGTICAVRGEDTQQTIVVETGADRVRIEFAKWAISTKGAPTGKDPNN
ncbi:hypothetical protein SDC9_101241 [bioreactor metagenome]|uniref:Sec translocon accessory complex subunit YajC n=1 Tax=bioreactor metagenome TaxID=1076179 RepID=A0A645AU68_9ZZZZ